MTAGYDGARSDTRKRLLEEGRRLASEREDLIAAGVDPSELVVPLSPTFRKKRAEEAARDAESGARSLTHVRCYRPEEHGPHRHVNEGPNGGCGLPEWCDGTPTTQPGGSGA